MTDHQRRREQFYEEMADAEAALRADADRRRAYVSERDARLGATRETT